MTSKSSKQPAGDQGAPRPVLTPPEAEEAAIARLAAECVGTFNGEGKCLIWLTPRDWDHAPQVVQVLVEAGWDARVREVNTGVSARGIYVPVVQRGIQAQSPELALAGLDEARSQFERITTSRLSRLRRWWQYQGWLYNNRSGIDPARFERRVSRYADPQSGASSRTAAATLFRERQAHLENLKGSWLFS